MTYTAMGFTKFGGPDVFIKMELELPSPQRDQVAVTIDATSVNFADVKARRGEYPVSGPPYVPGLDFVGRVIKVGSAENENLLGKRVIGFSDTGSYATEALVSTDLLFEIPDSIPTEIAAASPLLLGTSYALLTRRGGLRASDTLLVHSAAGGIGLTSVQLAKVLGVKTIIGLVSKQSKADAVLQAGANHIVVAAPDEIYSNKVREVAPQGVDYILNPSAGDTVQQDFEILNAGGQLVAFGMAAGKPGIVYTDQLHQSSRTVTGFSFGHLRRTDPKSAKLLFEQALPYLVESKVTFPFITEFSLWDAGKAHEAIESRNTIGKLVLKP